ncbi:MAG: rhodanese-like domain-containing protein [Anaeromicrobium sp.]|jgi:thiosulfate/3-mercaptopyruvate sulfurtransferase|uniref:rhodanese-like domain-containing protein n=1 Tax=Anaeromicrobium sp. TaxID=1929132 RepID=UPI0025D1608E|nr:rhodanese-like domain-containing protein [Anaeromicrobium sp.]MCT4596005.1 rhodanese-like domain-containing protein [Anaeromicrobium sp.]
MKKKLLAGLLMVTLSLSVVGCGAKESQETTGGENQKVESQQQQSEEKVYQYYTADQVKEAIEKGDDIILVDIQVEEEWNKHHIKGAISTKAYPVKTDEERGKVQAVIPKLEGDNPIIVVCPGGKGGAQRTINYLSESGIKDERLFILENGQGGWPYDELLEK